MHMDKIGLGFVNIVCHLVSPSVGSLYKLVTFQQVYY